MTSSSENVISRVPTRPWKYYQQFHMILCRQQSFIAILHLGCSIRLGRHATALCFMVYVGITCCFVITLRPEQVDSEQRGTSWFLTELPQQTFFYFFPFHMLVRSGDMKEPATTLMRNSPPWEASVVVVVSCGVPAFL